MIPISQVLPPKAISGKFRAVAARPTKNMKNGVQCQVKSGVRPKLLANSGFDYYTSREYMKRVAD